MLRIYLISWVANANVVAIACLLILGLGIPQDKKSRKIKKKNQYLFLLIFYLPDYNNPVHCINKTNYNIINSIIKIN